MTTHSKLSPSKRHRWALCPGSVREEAKYPEERSNPTAIDGTHTHSLLEKCLADKTWNAGQYVGQTLSDHDGEFTVSADRAERVSFALDYIKQRFMDIGNPDIHSEMQVDPFPIFFRNDLSGHVDVQLVSDNYLEIIDYKDGMSLVNAEGNLQLEQYAFGALCAHQDRDFKTIRMTIIQPKLREKGLQGILWAEWSYDVLMSRVGVLAAQAAACDAPDAPLVPGDEQCKYCRAKGACSARVGQMLDAAGITFDNISEKKDTNALTDDQIRSIVENADSIRKMLDNVETEALQRLENGKSIKGLKLVRGKAGNAKWLYDDEEKLVKHLTKIGIPKTKLYKKVESLLTPTQVKALKWESKGEEVTLSETQLMSLEGLITRSDGKLTVAPISDKREAVTINVASMFQPTDLPDWLKPLP